MAQKKSTDEKLYQDLLEEIALLRRENELLKNSTPLVGVRWYGKGGFTIGLDSPVRGTKKVVLQGYGDKNLIDYAAWQRIKNTTEVKGGIIVRDDTVIDELGIKGTRGDEDKVKNPNAFTDEEIVAIFKSKKGEQIRKLMESVTMHYAPQHFLEVAKREGISNPSKVQPVWNRYHELFTYFIYTLLHHHELTAACELAKLPWENISDEDMIEALVRKELEMKTQINEI